MQVDKDESGNQGTAKTPSSESILSTANESPQEATFTGLYEATEAPPKEMSTTKHISFWSDPYANRVQRDKSTRMKPYARSSESDGNS
jgi:hypothetical protein